MGKTILGILEGGATIAAFAVGGPIAAAGVQIASSLLNKELFGGSKRPDAAETPIKLPRTIPQNCGDDISLTVGAGFGSSRHPRYEPDRVGRRYGAPL